MKTMDEIISECTEIYRQVLQNNEIELDKSTNANDIDEWDSLNHTILLNDVQRHFGIKFKLKEIIKFKNVGDMCCLIKLKLEEV
jgi:acyl carrier protein